MENHNSCSRPWYDNDDDDETRVCICLRTLVSRFPLPFASVFSLPNITEDTVNSPDGQFSLTRLVAYIQFQKHNCPYISVSQNLQVRRVQSLVDTLDALKARNSNPLSNNSSSVSVTTQWETFDSGMGSLSAPPPKASSTTETNDWEQFD